MFPEVAVAETEVTPKVETPSDTRTASARRARRRRRALGEVVQSVITARYRPDWASNLRIR